VSAKIISSVEVSRLRSRIFTVDMGPHLALPWWSCCNCTREVSEAWGSGWSLDCGSSKCEECHNLGHFCPQCSGWKQGIDRFSRRYDPGSTTTDVGTSEGSSSCSDLIMDHLRAKGRHLPIFLDNHFIADACADSGSEVNCITSKFATQLGAGISMDECVFHLPIKGRELQSVGTAMIECRFPFEPFMAQVVKFFVFDKFVRDVVLGRSFLRATRTLDIYQDRLLELDVVPADTAVVRSLGPVIEYVQCWLDGTPLWSLPDTGSEINLISSDYAEKLGYNPDIDQWHINDEERMLVQFADCSTIMTNGTTNLELSFCAPYLSNSLARQLINPSCAPTIKGQTPNAQTSAQSGIAPDRKIEAISPTTRIIETFHVVDNLQYDVILGETLLAIVDAYNQHNDNFRVRESRPTSLIAVGRKKKTGEGSGKKRAALTEEQQFNNDFSNECDRCEKETQEIEDGQLCGMIPEEMVSVRKDQVRQTHLTWLREHRELLERFYPSYYEKMVPQEMG
jgi:hypothetical protein